MQAYLQLVLAGKLPVNNQIIYNMQVGKKEGEKEGGMEGGKEGGLYSGRFKS